GPFTIASYTSRRAASSAWGCGDVKRRSSDIVRAEGRHPCRVVRELLHDGRTVHVELGRRRGAPPRLLPPFLGCPDERLLIRREAEVAAVRDLDAIAAGL